MAVYPDERSGTRGRTPVHSAQQASRQRGNRQKRIQYIISLLIIHCSLFIKYSPANSVYLPQIFSALFLTQIFEVNFD